MILDTRIAGIPCQVQLTHYFEQPAEGYWADNDQDARGYVECEFIALDRRGRRAPWLDAKTTPADIARIRRELREAIHHQEIDA